MRNALSLFVEEYLTTTMDLSTVEHGAYLLLLLNYWRRGGPLPDDDRTLAFITRLEPPDCGHKSMRHASVTHASRMRHALSSSEPAANEASKKCVTHASHMRHAWLEYRKKLERYFRVEGGKWIHERLEAELAKVRACERARANAAKKAASARWEKALRDTAKDNKPNSQVEDLKQHSENISKLRQHNASGCVTHASRIGGSTGTHSTKVPEESLINKELNILAVPPLCTTGDLRAHAHAHAHTHAHAREDAERPSEAEVLAYAATIGLAEWRAKDWFLEMESCGWLDCFRRPVTAWRAALARVRTRWEADGRPSAPPARQPKAQGQQALSANVEAVKDQRELERVEKAIADLRASYDTHQSMTPEDRAKLRSLRDRREVLKRKLGFCA